MTNETATTQKPVEAYGPKGVGKQGVRAHRRRKSGGDPDYVKKHEEETRREQRILATYAWHLGRYLIEHDELPEEFNAGQFMYWSENYPELEKQDRIKFVDCYAQLEKSAKLVTARTLVATRVYGRGLWHAAFHTAVGQYLVFLALITGMFMTLVLFNATGVSFLNSGAPFWAAGLGTCIYLLRVTQEKMKTREFDPAFVPSHLIRLLLGILAGGSIALIPDLVTEGSMSLGGQMAFAFMLGYAVDIYYSVLDNIGGSIKQAK